MKKIQAFVVLVMINVLFLSFVEAEVKEVSSPNNQIKVVVEMKDKITYSVFFKNETLIAPSNISVTLKDQGVLGSMPKLMKSRISSVNEILTPVVPEKRKKVENNYNELSLVFKNNYELRFRVFNEGVAYRWVTRIQDSITVVSEEANFSFIKNENVYFPKTPGYITAFQHTYKYLSLDSISNEMMCITPALVDVANGPKVGITEADLRDYPGMFLQRNSNRTLSGKYAPYILNGNGRVESKDAKRADYIAKTVGARSFPWRVMVIAGNDADLINTQIVYCLGETSKITDISWIKPGKIAWDWYNANNIYKVDFRAGLNFDTYKYYIDFAADHKIEYVVLDEGWSTTENVMELNKDIKMDELTAYAQQKGVGLILWVEWKTFDENLDAATKRFQDWGIKGIKMDFMNRDDQYMVNLYERVASACAKRKLMVDFHGAFKPTGLQRTYPNIMTYEGVVGLENCKWSENSDPKYNVTMPFIRMMAGPVDYTPGAMNNAQKKDFKAIFDNPMGMGTRCHQLAMYVVYESPLQMLADAPTNYLKETECLGFLSEVPSVWDETIVLDAKVGQYVVLARKSGNNWYLAAMTNWDARELTVDLSRIAKGNFQLEEFVDGINADRNGNDYKKSGRNISTDGAFKIKMTTGGGWVAILRGV